jgi:hypothetical protein
MSNEMKIVLELMIPPHYQLGCTVVVRPSRVAVVPGSIPSLAILFSSYRSVVFQTHLGGTPFIPVGPPDLSHQN